MASAAVQTSLPINQSQNNIGFSCYSPTVDEYISYEKGSSLLANKYEYLNLIQTGSFGKVTLALNHSSNQRVAIKSMKKSIPGIKFMARHEITIMKKLGSHENIVQLVDVFETRKYIILVMEYVEQGDLYDAIHNKTELGLSFQNDPSQFVKLAKQLADVISYSHSKGIYHRDLKPENILLTNNGNIKLCDWGLSTLSRKSKEFNVGTEKYMAPEVLSNDFQLNYPHYLNNDLVKFNNNDYGFDCKFADYWSFGITLLFTMFGKCPFRRSDFNNDMNFISYIKNKEFFYDYYHNMSSTLFNSVVENCLNLNVRSRSLENCMNSLMIGMNTGFTTDQEYAISCIKQQEQDRSLQEQFSKQQQFVENHHYFDQPLNDSNHVELYDDLMFDMMDSSENFQFQQNNNKFFDNHLNLPSSASVSMSPMPFSEINHATMKPIAITTTSSTNLSNIPSMNTSISNTVFDSIPPSLVKSMGTTVSTTYNQSYRNINNNNINTANTKNTATTHRFGNEVSALNNNNIDIDMTDFFTNTQIDNNFGSWYEDDECFNELLNSKKNVQDSTMNQNPNQIYSELWC
ncbi:kinase activity protein [[Candida] boidinii]|nr:kinase activity protein [[Candida] boidinii]OWB82766.1 kinase activity protein [[Candida] boidinii]